MCRRLVAATAFALCLSARLAPAMPTYVWDNRYIRPDDQWIEKMTVDPFGNVIAIGQFYTELYFAVGQSYTGLGYMDAFVVKFDTYGNALWSHQIADVRNDRSFDVTTDRVGNVIVVGTMSASATDTDAFVAKYGPDGTQRWLKRFNNGDNHPQIALAVSTNLSKEIIVAGEFESSIDLGGGPLLPTGTRNFFLAKLGQLGEHIWSKRFVASLPFSYNLAALATGSDGQSVLLGDLNDSVNFGNGTMNTNGGADVFLARFDANGNVIWANHYGDADNQYSRRMATNESGQIAIVGHALGTVNFGGGALTSSGTMDPYVAVFTPAGAHVWSKIFPATGIQYGQSVAWASNQDVLMGCEGAGTLNFGGNALTINGPAYGVWLARFFGATGNHRWSTTFVSSNGVEGQIEEDDGRLYLGGSVSGTVNFGGGDSSGETDFLDIYLAKFGDALTAVSTAPIPARLEQNVPNPFNPRTTIPYTLEAPGHVQVGIYDAAGRVIAMLDGGRKAAGTHTLAWDGRDRNGKPVSSGVYFYRLEGMPGPARKMVLLK